MWILGSAKYALGISATMAVLAGCNSGASELAPIGPTTVSSVTGAPGYVDHVRIKPRWSAHASLTALLPYSPPTRGPVPLLGTVAPEIAKRGIYISDFSSSIILGYRKGQRANDPPFCSTPFNVGEVNQIAVDGAGNLMVPDGFSHTIIIGQGPNMCGAQAASIADPYGQPNDASSPNAQSGRIAVGNIFGNSSQPGSISICSVSAGCTANLTNPAIYVVAGVAMDNGGNCWASAVDKNGVASLTYFAACTGSGVQSTGFINLLYGSIDIDASGNLVTIDGNNGNGTAAVNVYSGCKPACTLLSSTPLLAYALCGRLNSLHNNKLAVADFNNGQVDIYRYSPTSGATYAYSFNNGLVSPQGCAYNKRSPQ